MRITTKVLYKSVQHITFSRSARVVLRMIIMIIWRMLIINITRVTCVYISKDLCGAKFIRKVWFLFQVAVISSAALTIVFLSGSQTELDVMKITSTNTLVDSWWKDINCSMPFVDPSLEKYICNKYSGCLDFFPLPSVDKNVWQFFFGSSEDYTICILGDHR